MAFTKISDSIVSSGSPAKIKMMNALACREPSQAIATYGINGTAKYSRGPHMPDDACGVKPLIFESAIRLN
jgi:hypothetical protein